MATIKRRHSKSRSRKRKAYYKVKSPTLTKCPNCSAYRLPHTVCPSCGFYKNRPVISKT